MEIIFHELGNKKCVPDCIPVVSSSILEFCQDKHMPSVGPGVTCHATNFNSFAKKLLPYSPGYCNYYKNVFHGPFAISPLCPWGQGGMCLMYLSCALPAANSILQKLPLC